MKMARSQHGSPHDRGGADAWYHRPRDPHKYPAGTYNEPRITLTDFAEIDEYNLGYDETLAAEGLHV